LVSKVWPLAERMLGMIAGKAASFVVGKDDPEFDSPVLIEVTDWSDRSIEVAFDFGKRRVYLSFRPSDLSRELKELRHE
jgi:hypothetical protein